MQIALPNAALQPRRDAVQVDIAGVDQPGRLELLVTLRAPVAHQALTPLAAPTVLAVDVSDGAIPPLLHPAIATTIATGAATGARIGVVAFDEHARLVRPADRPLSSASELGVVMPALACGGRSNLAAGLVRAIAEARRVLAAGDVAPRVVLVASGAPDCGVVDLPMLSRLVAAAVADGIAVDMVAAHPGDDATVAGHVARVAGGRLRTPATVAELTHELAVLTGTDVPPAALAVTASIHCHDGFDGPGTEPRSTMTGAPHTRVDDRTQVADVGDLLRGQQRTITVGLDKGDDMWTPVAAAELRVAWTDAETMLPTDVAFPIAFGLFPGETPALRHEDGR